MTRDPRVYLAHILERLDRVFTYTAGGHARFMAEPMIQDAVIRNLEVIGEAAKRIPDGFRSAHPSVPWRSLAALRDVLIHQYEGVSLPDVWQVVVGHLPTLRPAIAALLPPLDELERQVAEDDPTPEA